jgi:branched-chain amino acid transport system substrate-binding protein
MRRLLGKAGLAAAVALLPLVLVFTVLSPSSGAASGLKASAPGITPTTIKIGIFSDLTGAAASTFETTPGAIEAVFKQINAHGGVDGRKITWVVADSQSSPTGAQTAAKDLVENDHVFAIAENSALFFAAAPYLHAAGIPVTGQSLDGPEWCQQPNTNLFDVEGNCSPQEPAYTDGGFYKSIGTKKLSYVESNTPSSISAGVDTYTSIAKDGLSACDQTVVPLGAVNFTTYALSFKNAGCDTAECSCVLSSSLAMATALQQQGLTNVKLVFAAGPSQDIFESKQDEAAGNGAYFPGTTYTSGPEKAWIGDLKKYDSQYQGGIPDLGAELGWPAGNLIVEGLQVAGKNPTRQSFMTNLRKVTNWTDSGLSLVPINFVHFGQSPPTVCSTYVQFLNDKYVSYPKSGKPFCGKLIPGSHGVQS